MSISLAHLTSTGIIHVASTSISYGIQKLAGASTTMGNRHFLKIALANTAITTAAIYLGSDRHDQLITIGVAMFALYFFSSAVFSFVSSYEKGIKIAEWIGTSILTAGRFTGIFLIEIVAKGTLGISCIFLTNRWEQIKEVVREIKNDVAKNYTYYAFIAMLHVLSTGISYRIQRWIQPPTPMSHRHLVGISLVNTVVTSAALCLGGDRGNYLLESSIATFGLYFFSSTVLSFGSSYAKGITSAEWVGMSILTAGRFTGIFLVEVVAKVSLAIGSAFLVHQCRQIKDHARALKNHLVDNFLAYAGLGLLHLLSGGVSYGIQRWLHPPGIWSHSRHLVGISLVNTVVTSAAIYLGGNRGEYLITSGIATFALYFFSSTVDSFISSYDKAITSAEWVGASILTAGKLTGIFLIEIVAKTALLLGMVLLAHQWEQVKGNITKMKGYLVSGYHYLEKRYTYYTFPKYLTREDFKKLSTEEVEAARVHFTHYSHTWNTYSLPMQLAFNLILDKQNQPLIPLTVQHVETDIFTEEEIGFYAEYAYRLREVTASQAELFFRHNLKPPEFYLPAERLPEVEIPEAFTIGSISDAQVLWYHQILIAEDALPLDKEQYQEFAKRFFSLDLFPPSERFIFDLDIPLSSEEISKEQSFYLYFSYCRSGRCVRLPLIDQVRIQAALKKANLNNVLPDLEEEDICILPRFALRMYYEEYSNHRFLWEEKSLTFRLAFNNALQESGMDELEIRADSSFQNVFSFLGRRVVGIQLVSDRDLMNITCDLLSEVQRAYLNTIPDERINFLHPSMVPYLPDHKIAQIRRPALVRAIPEEKLYFIHPRIVSSLTDTQRRSFHQLIRNTSELSCEKTLLLLCPWFVQSLPKECVREISKEAEQFLFQSRQVTPLQNAFFSVLEVPQDTWNQMILIRETMLDLKTTGIEMHPMISSIPDRNLYYRMQELCHFFDAPSLPSYKCDQLVSGQYDSFFGDSPTVAEKDRRRMLYQFKHIVHALEQVKRVHPPVSQNTKGVIKSIIIELVDAMDACKTAWVSALGSFEGICNEHCDCPDCRSTRQNTDEVLLKTRLAGKLALYKKECFEKVILNAYNLHGEQDGQQVHTIEWYANELPHLNLYSYYIDLHPGVAKTRIPSHEMEQKFITEYTTTIKNFIKNLVSYGPKGDSEFRELVLDYLKGLIQRDARLSRAYVDKETAIGLATTWIWDEEKDYEVRDSLVGVLLYSFDHFAFDPELEIFNQTQANRKMFSENLNLIASKMLQLDSLSS